MKKQDYYTSISSKMMRDFSAVFQSARQPLKAHLTPAEIDDLEVTCRQAYVGLFPDLPYIGGRKNKETINVIMGAILISIIRPLVTRQLGERAIGRIIYDSFEGYFNSRPKWLRALLGRIVTAKYAVNRMKKDIGKNAFHEHEGNFQMEIVDSVEFDFGYNYTECAICKMFTVHDLFQYSKYVCLGDYALFDSIGVGFHRTATIAHGAEKCDFRFARKGATAKAWPPENLPEWQGNGHHDY